MNNQKELKIENFKKSLKNIKPMVGIYIVEPQTKKDLIFYFLLISFLLAMLFKD